MECAKGSEELQVHASEMIDSDWQDIFVKEHSFLHVEEIVVDEKYRHQGVASEWMLFAKEEAKRRDLPRVVLDVWSFNKDAVAFYESIGIREFRRFMEM